MFSDQKKTATYTVLVIFASFLIYLPTVRSGFIWDDIGLLTTPLTSGKDPYSFFFQGRIYYRPLLYLSLAVDFAIWHLNAFGYHLANIVFHSLNSLLVFQICRRLLANASFDRDLSSAGHSYSALDLSFVSALLFSVHPIHTESVAWISGRTDLLSTFFLLLAFLSFLIYEREEKVVSLGLSGLFFLFSLFSKENGTAFLGIIPLYGLIMRMPRKKVIRSSLFMGIIFLVYYVVFRRGSEIGALIATPGSEKAFFDSGLTFGKFIEILAMGTGYYFEKLLFPFGLNLLPPIPENPVFLFFFVLPFVLLVIFYFKRRKLEIFSLAWVFLALLPSFLIMYSKTAPPLAERYLYMPSVAFVILVGVVLGRIRKRKILPVAAFIVIFLLSAVTYDRLKDWKDDVTIWRVTAMQNPRSSLAQVNFASALIKTGDLVRAENALTKTLALDHLTVSRASLAYSLLGIIDLTRENFDKAETNLARAVDINERNNAGWYNLGLLYSRRADQASGRARKELLEKSNRFYGEAISRSPRYLGAIFRTAVNYLKLGDVKTARTCFVRVIDLDPQSKSAADAARFVKLIDSKNPILNSLLE